MPDNVAGVLAYCAGFLSGAVFLWVPRFRANRFVRFHTWQSILLNLALIAAFVSAALAGALLSSAQLGWVAVIAGLAAWLAWIVATAVLMRAAFAGRTSAVPIAGRWASALGRRH